MPSSQNRFTKGSHDQSRLRYEVTATSTSYHAHRTPPERERAEGMAYLLSRSGSGSSSLPYSLLFRNAPITSSFHVLQATAAGSYRGAF